MLPAYLFLFLIVAAAASTESWTSAKPISSAISTVSSPDMPGSDGAACYRIEYFQSLVDLAANEPLLELETEGDAAKMADVQAAAAVASVKLATMMGNATLVELCARIDVMGECNNVKMMQEIVALASRTRSLSNVFNGDQVKLDSFTIKAAEVNTRLQIAMKNELLTDACKALNDQDAAPRISSSYGNMHSMAASRGAGVMTTSLAVAIFAGVLSVL